MAVRRRPPISCWRTLGHSTAEARRCSGQLSSAAAAAVIRRGIGSGARVRSAAVRRLTPWKRLRARAERSNRWRLAGMAARASSKPPSRASHSRGTLIK